MNATAATPADPPTEPTNPRSLLDHVRALVESERGLTEALEHSLPLLSSHGDHHPHRPSPFASSVLSSQSPPPLLPTPRNMSEVQTILAVARSYSLRTSAPSGWNPNLPVIGFATPNPLPHQLRGGALGAMQLRMVREERMRKRREVEDLRERERRAREEEEERRLRKLREEEEGEDGMDLDDAEGGGMAGKRKREHAVDGSNRDEGDIDPKKRELLERQKRQMAQMAANGQRAGNTAAARQTAEEVRAKKEMANMNLSDSSSSDEEDSSEEE
mmetsp:Transcript_12614/g.24623  ORF Transcript_12614/g.24623 Transcript_12614/m.24623 type:complete len:273 (-) Transcript_12614:58-876(-)